MQHNALVIAVLLISAFNCSIEDKKNRYNMFNEECNEKKVVSHWVRYGSDCFVDFHLSEYHYENGRNRYSSSYKSFQKIVTKSPQ